MEVSEANEILKILAIQKGISVNTIRREIASVVEIASKSQDQGAESFWKSIPHKGDSPTPEETIAFFADYIVNILETTRTDAAVRDR